MKIGRDTVVELHYELRDESDEVVESTREGGPIAILFGARNVVFGLEQALEGHEAGDIFEARVAPVDGYGLRREGLQGRYSKKHFARPKALRVGDQVQVRTPEGILWVTVNKVGSKMVDVDLNHPMAGKALHYQVEVVSVRDAQVEELAHGHVHGPGGHQH